MARNRVRRCERCGELTGRGWFAGYGGRRDVWTLTCLCNGIVCRYCKRNAIHRPISTYFDERLHQPLHVAYFGNMLPCDECSAKGVKAQAQTFTIGAVDGTPFVVAGDDSGPPAWFTGAVVCDQCGWPRADGNKCLCAGWVCEVCRRRAIPRSVTVCLACRAARVSQRDP